MYYIWFDESDKEGTFYSNFYGGILVDSKDYEKVINMSNIFIKELGIENEIKWQRVNEFSYEKYKKVVDYIFDLLENGYIKIRIFFRNNQYEALSLTKEQKRNTYTLLYYQFIKHAFGLQYSNNTGKEIQLKIMLDDIPVKGEDKNKFKNYIFGLNKDAGFNRALIKIQKDHICEVDSSDHLMLQFMDLILGSMCFRLNNKHKIKDTATNRRGKRTITKEKLYKHINARIRKLHPGFNIGESTGIRFQEERWTLPYSHWSFKPSKYVRNTAKAKRKTNSPCMSTE